MGRHRSSVLRRRRYCLRRRQEVHEASIIIGERACKLQGIAINVNIVFVLAILGEIKYVGIKHSSLINSVLLLNISQMLDENQSSPNPLNRSLLTTCCVPSMMIPSFESCSMELSQNLRSSRFALPFLLGCTSWKSLTLQKSSFSGTERIYVGLSTRYWAGFQWCAVPHCISFAKRFQKELKKPQMRR